jgi:signal transduction histidine kinase
MMRAVSSLRTRIFLACTLLTALSLGLASAFVHTRASIEAEAELRRGLDEAAAVVDRHWAVRSDTFTRMARLVADLPRLKAAVETGDPPTVQPIAVDYRDQMHADVLVLTGPDGNLLGWAGDPIDALPIGGERPDEEISTFLPHPRGLLQVVGVPIVVLGPLPEVLGRLTVAFFMDDALAAEFRGLTGSEIAFAAGDRVLASSLPAGRRGALEPILVTSTIAPVVVGEEEYLALARPMAGHLEGAAIAPVTLILRSRTERLRFLATVRAGLAVALVVTVLAATILSYAVARTMTRPLSAVTGAMAEVATTGDLTRKVSLQDRSWADADARLLAASFNTLTDSIARFQREASQKERLSSLGRLSTVVAHEIRNPLMIIRASLRALRREGVTPAEMREAAADIDEETRRLDRIVSEVLDFARPIRFELAPADLNEVCRVSAAAAWAGEAHPAIRLDLDPAVPPILTDSERLRTALVNVLANSRQSVEARPHAHAGGAGTAAPVVGVADDARVVVSTRRTGDRIAIAIRDSGTGIAADDLAHVFDPYFTTRRAGTGLGLPIAKNIVEGLGGSIVVTSVPGAGTEIRIDLPMTPPETGA